VILTLQLYLYSCFHDPLDKWVLVIMAECIVSVDFDTTGQLHQIFCICQVLEKKVGIHWSSAL